MADKKTLWIKDLGGMMQRQDMDKIPDNMSPFLMNISLDKPGTWRKRKGSALLNSTAAGAGTLGMIDYAATDMTTKLHAYRGTTLYTYTPSTYTSIDATDITGTSKKVQSVNYLGRVYWISPEDNLRYESGSTTTQVLDNAGSPIGIKGNTIAVAQRTLFVGGSPERGRDRVYYTTFDLTTFLGTHNFGPDAATWSFATTTNFFSVETPVTAMISYGMNGLVYVFTKYSLYSFNMAYEDKATGVNKELDIGCAGPRAVTICNGILMWMDPEGRIWGWKGEGSASLMSYHIEDDSNGDAIINKISATWIPEVAAGSLGSKVYFSIGDVTLWGVSYTNCVLVGQISPDASDIQWSIYSYPLKPTIFTNAFLSGRKVLLYGNESNLDIYQMETGTNDGSTAVTSFARTAFLDFSMTFSNKENVEILVKYKPQSVQDNTNLKISTAKNGTITYSAASDPDASDVTAGVIDMYSADTVKLDDVKKILYPANNTFRTLSVELRNAQANEGMEISALGFKIEEKELNLQVLRT